jgi:hypothetical protein
MKTSIVSPPTYYNKTINQSNILLLLLLLLKISIGGVYPLSSASAFEGEDDGDETSTSSPSKPTDTEEATTNDNSSSSGGGGGGGGNEGQEIKFKSRTKAGWAVFWQLPGQMVPYFVGLILLAFYKNSAYEAQFRVKKSEKICIQYITTHYYLSPLLA